MVKTIPVTISTMKVMSRRVGHHENVLLVLAQTDKREATEQIRIKCLTDVLLNQARPAPLGELAEALAWWLMTAEAISAGTGNWEFPVSMTDSPRAD